jgi:hypothetical protein
MQGKESPTKRQNVEVAAGALGNVEFSRKRHRRVISWLTGKFCTAKQAWTPSVQTSPIDEKYISCWGGGLLALGCNLPSSNTAPGWGCVWGKAAIGEAWLLLLVPVTPNQPTNILRGGGGQAVGWCGGQAHTTAWWHLGGSNRGGGVAAAGVDPMATPTPRRGEQLGMGWFMYRAAHWDNYTPQILAAEECWLATYGCSGYWQMLTVYWWMLVG